MSDIPSPVLVLRPEPGASRTVAALEAAGFRAVAQPLFTVEPTGQAQPDGPFDAIVASSAHGAEALANQPGLDRALPAFAVGERTADMLRAGGFTDVRVADGDAAGLLALVAASGIDRLLIAQGEDHKPELRDGLAALGRTAARWTAYRACAADTLPPGVVEALRTGPVAVTHFSRRGAETFARLVETAGLAAQARAATHICLSADVAEGLAALAPLDTLIAARPDEASLVAALAARRPEAAAIAAGERHHPGTLLHRSASQRKAAARMQVAGDGMKRTDKSQQTGKPDDAPETIPASAASAAASMPESVPGEAKPDLPGPATAEPSGVEPVATAVEDPAARIDPPHVEAPVPVVSARSGPGWAGVLVASLLAGGIGAGAATVLPGFLSSAPGPDPRLAEQITLANRISTLERAAAARPAAPAPAMALPPEADAALKAASAAAEATRAQVIALEGRLQELAARPAATPSGAPQPAPDIGPLIEPLKTDISRAGQALAEARARQETMTQQIATLTERLATGAHAPAAASAAAARLVVLDRVQGAVASGRPFGDEVAALERLGAEAAHVAALKASASAGVPSQAALQQAFRMVRGPISAEPTQADAPLTERLLRLTDGLVRVRASGDAQGSSPAALAARIDQALERGETAQALGLWRQLPEPARRASESFARQLEARTTVDAALASLSQSALAALARAP